MCAFVLTDQMVLLLWLLLAVVTHAPGHHHVLRTVQLVAVQEGGDDKTEGVIPHVCSVAVVALSKKTGVPIQERVILADVHKNSMLIRALKDAAILLLRLLLREEPSL
jgi:hypothetical protein